MYITEGKRDDFNNAGYVLIPGVFHKDEIAAMVRAVESGGVDSSSYGRSDATGKAARLALWNELKDDIWSAASTCPRITNAVRCLLGEEISFFHGKVMLKEAGTGGKWEWHQDYGYWYEQGFGSPRMLSAFVALDAATRENGCLQVLRGSHKLGRVDHGKIGDQTGVEEARMQAFLDRFELVHVEMEPGSVLFFHSNLFHCSAANESDKHRRSFIMCYTAKDNICMEYNKSWSRNERRPCPTGRDGSLLEACGLAG